MTEVNAAADELMVCANCTAASHKLMTSNWRMWECDGCQSVSYCSDICQENHREQHKEGCKRIAAELHDRNLFEQPEESHLGECPICFFPLSLDMAKSSIKPVAAKYFVMAVAMPDTLAMEVTIVHSVESRM